MNIGPYISSMIFTAHKMQENPPEKAEKHLRMAKKRQKTKKRKNLSFPQQMFMKISGCLSFDVWSLNPEEGKCGFRAAKNRFKRRVIGPTCILCHPTETSSLFTCPYTVPSYLLQKQISWCG